MSRKVGLGENWLIKEEGHESEIRKNESKGQGKNLGNVLWIVMLSESRERVIVSNAAN